MRGCNRGVRREQAKHEAEAHADALRDVAWRAKEYPPRTLAGLLIHACALSGYPDAEEDGLFNSRGPTTEILGRGLADAVLRVEGVTI